MATYEEIYGNSHKITKDGVLQSVLECEDCGKREVEPS